MIFSGKALNSTIEDMSALKEPVLWVEPSRASSGEAGMNGDMYFSSAQKNFVTSMTAAESGPKVLIGKAFMTGFM